jgi:hypothetical protein
LVPADQEFDEALRLQTIAPSEAPLAVVAATALRRWAWAFGRDGRLRVIQSRLANSRREAIRSFVKTRGAIHRALITASARQAEITQSLNLGDPGEAAC